MGSSFFLPSDPQKAFHYAGYRSFWFAVLATSFSAQIMAVAVAWQVYDTTGNPLYLGLIGLAQFLPSLLLVLVTGWVSDRFSRRGVMAVSVAVETGCAAAFLWFAVTGFTDVGPIFLVLVFLGVSRAFLSPARASLAPNLVPQKALGNAIAVNATAWQGASVIGPAAGGLLYGVSPEAAYGVALGLAVLSFVLLLNIPKPDRPRDSSATSGTKLLDGFKYVWHQKVVLGAISLDLFAVLLGGAVALLPVYARDILEVGPWGLGLLRAAPGVGAILVALILTHYPVRDHAGKVLLWFVAAFGFFTVIFGFSTSIWVAVPALFLVGATDMVSVVIRETLLQLWTPDEVRGRVNAVISVFLGASNELGEFRAGVMAFWIGAIPAVTIGGLATMGVAAGWRVLFPEMAKIRKLEKPKI